MAIHTTKGSQYGRWPAIEQPRPCQIRTALQNNGRWNGKTIIPKVWVNRTFTRHRKITWGTDEFYGYLFWNKQYEVKGKTYETYYCSGNGGNKVFIFKEEPLVVVVTATAYNTPYAHPQVDKIMEQFILPAVIGQ